jgi:hypothetical protein
MKHSDFRKQGRPKTLLAIIAAVSGLLLVGSIFADPSNENVRRESPAISFNRDIRPILGDHCFVCHGPDPSQRESDLRLDDRQAAIDFGAIVPGKADQSPLIERIESEDSDWVMPPPTLHKPLNDTQRKLLRDWIDQGAIYEVHWAYQAPGRPEIPEAPFPNLARNPIDHFVQQPLAAAGLRPAAEAESEILLRRLYLDLIGLPPSTTQLQGQRQQGEEWDYAELVEQLLESPHFGERMATAWLDVVRYADTVGYHGDQNQNAFPYRDWVIKSFNQNLPFDEFTRMQLAGDLYPDPTDDHYIASCFNRLNMVTREGGAQPGEYLAKYAADRVRTIGGAWLGSTVGCAECHDHKYDPFSTRDFYQLAAFFADLKQWGVYHDYPYTPNPDLRGWSNDHPFPPEREVAIPYLQERIVKLRAERDQLAVAAIGSTPADPQRWLQWRQQVLDFLQEADSGWKPFSLNRDPQAEGWELQRNAVDRWQISGQSIDRLEFQIESSIPITAIRWRLWPSEEQDRLIFPRQHSARDLRLAVEILAADGTSRKTVPLYFADSQHKLHRYYNGFEIAGVQQVWRAPNRAELTESVWIPQEPIDLQTGERLVVRLTGNQTREISLDFSCLVPETLSDSLDWNKDLERAQQPLDEWQTDPFFARQWWLTARETKAERARIRQIEREIYACRGGTWPVMVSESTGQPLETRVLPRGDWQDLSGELVEPQFPGFLQGLPVPSEARLNRMDLANWLVAPDNPLTARVQVNRIWSHFFGSGLSSVLDDFGIQGQFPTHPELLDWLAVEFRESGWDLKHLIRLIVNSHTYRQSSRPAAEANELDPGNRWLSRQNTRRLEAEIVRDNALAVAGLIELELGGPPVFPYQPPGYYKHLQFPDRNYTPSGDQRQYRRGVYVHWQRTFLHPMLANFDAPPREECTGMRSEANTPQQALTLLNDKTFVEAAIQLLARLDQEIPSAGLTGDLPRDQARIDWLFQVCLNRPAAEAEQQSLLDFLASQRQHWSENPEDAGRLLRVALPPAAVESDVAERAAWVSLGRVILNLHETITRY